MIYLRLVRIGHCELCEQEFYMPADGQVDFPCPRCRAMNWMYGKESIESIRIRTGMTFAARRVDGRRDRRKEPGQGAKSLKRRERARAQYQGLKPKPEDGE